MASRELGTQLKRIGNANTNKVKLQGKTEKIGKHNKRIKELGRQLEALKERSFKMDLRLQEHSTLNKKYDDLLEELERLKKLKDITQVKL